MIYLGIDYSYTSPAICTYDSEKGPFSLKTVDLFSLSQHKIKNFDNFHFKNISKDWYSQIDRFARISEWALSIITEYESRDCSIAIEGYSMGSKGQTFEIGENCGILKYNLYRLGYGFEVPAPTQIKKLATGKGNAKKEAMVSKFVEETGFNIKEKLQPNRLLGSPTTDLVDAYFLCKWMTLNNIT